MNYGAIGVILAHEITHGYDNQGVFIYLNKIYEFLGQYHDEKGNKRDWWKNTTKENFYLKKQCFIDQYSMFEIPFTNGIYVKIILLILSNYIYSFTMEVTLVTVKNGVN